MFAITNDTSSNLIFRYEILFDFIWIHRDDLTLLARVNSSTKIHRKHSSSHYLSYLFSQNLANEKKKVIFNETY